MSSLEPSILKYACQITSPASGVQPITFICNSFSELEASLELAAKELNPLKVELTFHENRINTFKNKIDQHQARVDQLNDPNYKPEDDIPMEEVGAENVKETEDEVN